MTPPIPRDDLEDIKELFSSALDLRPDLRSAFLDENCKSKQTRLEVESLLQARDDAGSFLEDLSAASVVQDAYQRTASERLIGGMIGQYRIVREIGRGGMGVVLLATRETFHQQVAIKIIKRGMDSDAIVERFYREREILASLNHPFIANLLDGGTTADGLPYFVMEYVEGVPINEFCSDLKETEILSLFRKVCSAVSFAHEKLIVHRDLKPSNIMVTANGEPKLLDFGIAKLLDASDPSETRTQQRVLTPAYASPEQASGRIVGTGSDVYSLGKILTELLENGKGHLVGTVNTDPTAPEHETRRQGGDLQNILAMALHAVVERRYGSAESFSNDIQRYMEDLPVAARRDSVGYRAQKFLKRNRLKVVFAGLLTLSLGGGVIATIMKANEAHYQRQLAENRFLSLRNLSDLFITEIHGAIQDLPGSLPARQLILRRATEQLDAMAADALDNPTLQDELGQAYSKLATLPDMNLDEKESNNKKVLAIYNKLLLDEPNNLDYREKLALAYMDIADTEKVRGSVENGFGYCKNAVTILDEVTGDKPNDVVYLSDFQDALAELSTYSALKGDTSGSLWAIRRRHDIVEQLRNMNVPIAKVEELAGLSHLQLGTALTTMGDYKTAKLEIQTALDAFIKEEEEKPNDTSVKYRLWAADRRMAIAVELDGDTKAGLEYAQRSLSIMEALLTSSPKDIGYHRNAAISHILVGQLLVQQNKAVQAVTHFRSSLELSQEVLSNNPEYFESKIDLARSYGNLGNAMVITGKRIQGLSHLSDAVKIYDETSNVDIENAILKRDYAETVEWLASALEITDKLKSADYYRASSVLWNELRSAGKLSAADLQRS